MNDSPGMMLSSLTVRDKQHPKLGGCVGMFFQLFDWNRRLSGKQLFSPKLLTQERRRHSIRKEKEDKMTVAKLLLIADENRGGSSSTGRMKDDTDTMATCPVASSGDVSKLHRSPGAVGRLMGLECMPCPGNGQLDAKGTSRCAETQQLPGENCRCIIDSTLVDEELRDVSQNFMEAPVKEGVEGGEKQNSVLQVTGCTNIRSREPELAKSKVEVWRDDFSCKTPLAVYRNSKQHSTTSLRTILSPSRSNKVSPMSRSPHNSTRDRAGNSLEPDGEMKTNLSALHFKPDYSNAVRDWKVQSSDKKWVRIDSGKHHEWVEVPNSLSAGAKLEGTSEEGTRPEDASYVRGSTQSKRDRKIQEPCKCSVSQNDGKSNWGRRKDRVVQQCELDSGGSDTPTRGKLVPRHPIATSQNQAKTSTSRPRQVDVAREEPQSAQSGKLSTRQEYNGELFDRRRGEDTRALFCRDISELVENQQVEAEKKGKPSLMTILLERRAAREEFEGRLISPRQAERREKLSAGRSEGTDASLGVLLNDEDGLGIGVQNSSYSTELKDREAYARILTAGLTETFDELPGLASFLRRIREGDRSVGVRRCDDDCNQLRKSQQKLGRPSCGRGNQANISVTSSELVVDLSHKSAATESFDVLLERTTTAIMLHNLISALNQSTASNFCLELGRPVRPQCNSAGDRRSGADAAVKIPKSQGQDLLSNRDAGDWADESEYATSSFVCCAEVGQPSPVSVLRALFEDEAALRFWNGSASVDRIASEEAYVTAVVRATSRREEWYRLSLPEEAAEVFQRLEKQVMDTWEGDERRLVFDCVNEVVTELEKAGRPIRTRVVYEEVKSWSSLSGDLVMDDLIAADFRRRRNEWASQITEIVEIVWTVERALFRLLVDDLVGYLLITTRLPPENVHLVQTF